MNPGRRSPRRTTSSGPGWSRTDQASGDLDIAGEVAAEAFVTAVQRWPADGVPPNPGAWLTTTANRKAIDRIRRENKRDDKQKEAQLVVDATRPSLPAQSTTIGSGWSSPAVTRRWPWRPGWR